MAVEDLARVLLKMFDDEAFARNVLTDPKGALKDHKLTDEEFRSVAERVEPWNVEPLKGVQTVGAFRLLSQHLNEVPSDLRKQLNQALARRAAQPRAIPVTGS
jgi:hypothetical protein